MKKELLRRIVVILLCLCMLPVASLAQDEMEYANRAAVDLSLRLHPEGFPEETRRLKDWAKFLERISIKGLHDSFHFLQPDNRVVFNGIVYVDGKETLPFYADNYMSYRYLVSPAFKNEGLHFQMHNFLDFMLKPYYYMGLPTQYLGLLLYPEASYYIGSSYYNPIAETLAGEGTRNIPYEDLSALCENLDLLVTDDEYYQRVYVYITALLTEVYAAESTLSSLAELETYLDFLDPDQEGMTITVEGNQQTYVLGKTKVFEKKQVGDALSLALTLPTQDGYLITFTHDWTPSAQGAKLSSRLLITLGEDKDVNISLEGSGLPCPGDTKGQGQVVLTLGGNTFTSQIPPQAFDFRWDLSQANRPHTLNLDIDWLHPKTQRPALSAHFNAYIKYAFPDIMQESAYLKNDVFSMNEEMIEEYKEKYSATVALSMMPIVMAMPAGVVDDIVEFATQSGILQVFGF